MSPPKIMSSPLPWTTVCKLVSGGPVTAAGVPLPYTLQDTTAAALARDTSRTYICMGLQFSDWYSGLPTFRLWGGWWPRRRAIGGMACPSAPATCGGLEDDEGGVPEGGGAAPPPFTPAGGVPCVCRRGDEEGDRFFTASRPRRKAAGETAPGGVHGDPPGGVCTPLVLDTSGWGGAPEGGDSQP